MSNPDFRVHLAADGKTTWITDAWLDDILRIAPEPGMTGHKETHLMIDFIRSVLPVARAVKRGELRFTSFVGSPTVDNPGGRMCQGEHWVVYPTKEEV